MLVGLIAIVTVVILLIRAPGIIAVPAPVVAPDPSVTAVMVPTGQDANVAGVDAGTGTPASLCAAQAQDLNDSGPVAVGSGLLELTTSSIQQELQVTSVDLTVTSVTPVTVCGYGNPPAAQAPAPVGGPIVAAAPADITAAGFLPQDPDSGGNLGPSSPVDFNLGPNGTRIIDLTIRSADRPTQPELYGIEVDVEMSQSTQTGEVDDSPETLVYLLVK